MAVGQLDAWASSAVVAADSSMQWSKAQIVEGDKWYLQNGFHPSLEKQDPVPCSYNLDARLTLVTGPNMGGKSTLLRVAGVCTVLAHSGLMVPAEDFGCPLTDAVLVRIGAGDDLRRGVSTFMAEMLDVASAFRVATASSLVLIDELGRGTGSSEGFGLAWSICKHLSVDIGSRVLCATHFQELALMEKSLASVQNLSLQVLTTDKLAFTYKVLREPCHKSFGVNVARMAGIPSNVADNAENLIKK